ncbi:hypothetical protein GGTG_14409 [Gaeumannomyces tritici R3-111a-1]|uniref:Uncharacterized protein n=1 Tax=Gaeumannomyces tritici (strain R3-111a-1) TaxID=644352 RepID=J3PLE2_GAET3|nr:hypothetical protein GGTG_14409 [Gaeumannomyces tritici R3-111a-1]EJT68013.1 hypothetical protein GGTG_14409 [Gaeumannomyces tritici R3-111a-1]
MSSSSNKITDRRIAELKAVVQNRDQVKEKLQNDLKELEDLRKAVEDLEDQLDELDKELISSAAFAAKHKRGKAEVKKSTADQISEKKLLIQRWEEQYEDRKQELEDLEAMVEKLQE